ncbi:glycosyltransferase [Noviherbaspirillum suwonense]|uniref:Glycosyltransferase involved in cell wall bisynthesis n=1 Tax=Noviherbaspirillum suwonense TaxID=1224511 RepID=A0ABY1QF06_9BURK|nr:glycosyltransferase [Noviherbaspirillum suwonense]SMP69467.1 Glycosyltransferase involved in cell wall bisynthesis [Noviherbaspirillum suwonense]
MHGPDILNGSSPLRRSGSAARQGVGARVSSGLFSLLSRQGQNAKLTVLLFHKVPLAADPLTPTEPTFSQFEHILDFLQDNATVLPLADAASALARGKLPRKAVALTFDDGYDEWLTTVSPTLRARNMHATFFVTTEQLDGPALWHERIIAAVRALPDHGARLPYGFASYDDLRYTSSRIRLISELQERLKYAPLPERLGAIEMIEAQARSPLVWPRPFDRESVRALHSQGFEIGGHTINHPILNECSDAQATNEIAGCKDELETIIGGKVHAFAYPNGRPLKDYDGRHVAMVKSCGYTVAVATSGGAARQDSDIYQLPRFTPWGATNERMALQLARNLVERERKAVVALQHEVRATPVRCLLVASTFAPLHGGSAVVYENLCKHMPAGSVRVLSAKINYLTGHEIEDWREYDRAASFPVDRIPLLRPLMQPPPANIGVSMARFAFTDIPLYARVLLAAARLVRHHQINVICIGELVYGTWLGIALRKVFGTRLMIYVHGEEITTATSGRMHGNKRRDYLHAADKVIAVSAFTCDALTQQMGLRAEQMSLVHNGVDTDRFTPGERDQKLVQKHGLGGKKVVLTLGRLVPRKGADMAVRAMAKVIRQRPDVHYLIVGDGELRPELERLIAQEDLGAQMTLVGSVSEPDLVRYFRLCDLFLMPNRTMPDGDTEGFGLVFREANACGKPVIGGRAGGAVEAVVDGESGYLVNGENVDDIAARVLDVLDDEALAAHLGARGLEIARASNTREVASRFVQIAERVLRQR